MATRKNRQRNQLLITAGVMGVLALGVGAAVMTLSSPQQPQPQAAPPDPAASSNPASPSNSAVVEEVEEAAAALVDDDGRTLWASPTDGGPLPLNCLPAGCQMIVSLRPAAIAASDDGRIFLEQFEPALRPVVAELAKAAPVDLGSIARLTIGVRPTETFGRLDRTFVIETDAPATSDAAEPRRVARGASGDIARFAGGAMVIAAPATIDEVLESRGEPPPLRRELEQLVAASDGDRHATLLVAPNFLFAEGQSLFADGVAALRGPLFEQLPDELRGLLLSVHFADDDFYWEARAAAASDLPATQLTRLMDGRVRRWPSELQLAVLDLNPAPHGRRVVANLPAMARLAADYTRRGVDRQQAVLNGYLPPGAGHNLLIAAELMLAQLSGPGPLGDIPQGVLEPDGSYRAQPKTPRTFAERLRQPATVVFDRDTLEMALRFLSDELGVPIVIRGRDLQLEGITKNQSFGLDQQGRPGDELLVEILRLANPDRTATGPADPRQKLVFVVGRDDDGVDTVFVTTRAGAARQGEQLPSVFEP